MKTIALTKRSLFSRTTDSAEKKPPIAPIQYTNLPVFHFSSYITKQFKNKRIKGIILGNFGAMNYGDEAILAGQLEEFKKIKQCSMSIIARFPERINHLHHVPAVLLTNIFSVIKSILASDFLIIGGGGIFCRNDAGMIGFLYQLYTLAIFSFAIAINKKVYVIGVGMYTNMNSFLAGLTLALFKKADIITVRDEHSYKYIRSSLPSVKFYKDNSFLMKLTSKDVVKKDAFFRNIYTDTRYNIGIAIKKPESLEETKSLLKTMITFINENNAYADFWFYPLDSHSRYYNDLSFAKDIKSLSDRASIIHIIPETWHPKKLFSSFPLMDYFISMRLHSSIFAHRTHVPFYAISYDKKCASFLKSINTPFVTVPEMTYTSLDASFTAVKQTIKRPIITRPVTAIPTSIPVQQSEEMMVPIKVSLRLDKQYDY